MDQKTDCGIVSFVAADPFGLYLRAIESETGSSFVNYKTSVVLLALLHVVFFDLFCLESCYLR